MLKCYNKGQTPRIERKAIRYRQRISKESKKSSNWHEIFLITTSKRSIKKTGLLS